MHYRTIDSFTDYLIVAIDGRSVEHHHRIAPGKWLLTEHDGESVVELESLGITLAVVELWTDLDRLGR